MSMIAEMNWRRGVLLACIHVCVAGSVLVWNESRFWHFIRTDLNRPVPMPTSDPGMGTYFNPCEGWKWEFGPIPPNQQILGFANLPIAMITGGHEPCNTPTRLDEMLQLRYGKTHNSEILTLLILSSAIAAQWFLLGAFPLNRPKRRWLEPGALITICTPPAIALAFIPESGITLPLLALAVWAYWLGVLVWCVFRSMRQYGSTRLTKAGITSE